MCGFNPACYIWKLVEPFWFWLQLGFWVLAALVALAVLYKVKQVFGWYGVVAVLSFGIGAAAFKGLEGGPTGRPVTPRPAPEPQKPIFKDGDDWLKQVFNGRKRK